MPKFLTSTRQTTLLPNPHAYLPKKGLYGIRKCLILFHKGYCKIFEKGWEPCVRVGDDWGLFEEQENWYYNFVVAFIVCVCFVFSEIYLFYSKTSKFWTLKLSTYFFEVVIYLKKNCHSTLLITTKC